MKGILFSFWVSFFFYSACGQQLPTSKPVIDSAAINHWPSLGGSRAISNDGKYFMYSVDNDPVGSNTLIIRSTENSWQKEFVGIGTGVFSGDNKEFIFQNVDTLFFLFLGKKDEVKKITGVTSYGQPSNCKGRWLFYQLANEKKELVVRDFTTNRDRHFDHVESYSFDETAETIQLTTTEGIELASLKDGKVEQLWSGKDYPGASLVSFTLDTSGSQACFLTEEQKDSQSVIHLWWWRKGMDRAVERANPGSEGMDKNMSVYKYFAPQFCADGNSILFAIASNQQHLKPGADAISVDIWNWQDSVLQETQLAGDRSNPRYVAVTGAGSGPVIRLEQENEQIISGLDKGDYIIISKNNNPGERFWLNRSDSIWLVSVKNGTRVLLPIKSTSYFYFSPDGRYLIYYEIALDGPYISYNLKTGQVRRISEGISDHSLTWHDGFERPLNEDHYFPVGLAGWEPSDSSLLVYDNYDIWKLSLNASYPPVNMTNGYGQSHHIRLRLAVDDQDHNSRLSYRPTDSLLLVAFNTENKYNGFYRMLLSDNNNPKLLSMGPWTIWHKGGMINSNLIEFDNAGMSPMKSANANIWLLIGTTATQAPNYFLTRDFKNYKALTDLEPQQKYNWLTSELISWMQPDGISTQGVLYKPEDFDPHKKYPVLINYYEQLSHRVYEYPQPEYTGSAHINIPWFVSRGYLVFTPDIYYHKNSMTQSATTTVESAGRMLSKLTYVDSLHIGIAGHSWGGTETNYIVTHTHLFAAALSGAGGEQAVDLISNSLGMDDNGGGAQNDLGRYEKEIGATLWQRPDLWIHHSPIFQADQLTTPLLIFHNKGDGGSNTRALEFFIALRRLEKRVWMLQYDNGGHSVGGKDAEDFTIRITQFFDHFLKGAPIPIWMSKGVPARLKGIDNGLRFDTEN